MTSIRLRGRWAISLCCLAGLFVGLACQRDSSAPEPSPTDDDPPKSDPSETTPLAEDPEIESNLWVERYQRRRQPELMRQLGELEEKLRRSPQDAQALRDLGWLEYQLGRTDDALEHLAESARLDRRDAETAFRLGVVYLGEQKLEEAVKSLRRAIDRAPRHSLAWHQLGVARLRQERADEAEAALTRAAQINPLDAESRVLLARLRAGSDDEAAISLLEEAVQIDRYHRGAYDQLRRLYRRRGRIEEAKRATEKVEDLALLDDLGVLQNPLRPERFLAEADYYRRHGRFDRAEEVLGEGIRIHPSVADLRLLAGRVQAESGDWADAREHFEKAIELEPESVEPYKELADWLHQASGESVVPPELVEHLRKAAERWPELASRLPEGGAGR